MFVYHGQGEQGPAGPLGATGVRGKVVRFHHLFEQTVLHSSLVWHLLTCLFSVSQLRAPKGHKEQREPQETPETEARRATEVLLDLVVFLD